MEEMNEMKDVEKYAGHYSAEGLWKKLAKVAKKAGIKLVNLALLLYYVLTCDEVETKDKLLIMGALGYLILPFDLIPDGIPGIGFTDDLAALIYAYKAVKVHVTPEMEEKAKKQLVEWFGEFDDEDLDLV